MSFNDFLAIDCIDLIPTHVLQPKVKEQELLGFLFNDKERKVRASASNTYYFFYNLT
jgi:hypothetical protein